jgi:hypothetical protein
MEVYMNFPLSRTLLRYSLDQKGKNGNQTRQSAGQIKTGKGMRSSQSIRQQMQTLQQPSILRHNGI